MKNRKSKKNQRRLWKLQLRLRGKKKIRNKRKKRRKTRQSLSKSRCGLTLPKQLREHKSQNKRRRVCKWKKKRKNRISDWLSKDKKKIKRKPKQL